MALYPTLADVQAAAARIKPYAHRTPVLTCRSLDDLVGATLLCKCENFQKVGAFKFRGACNAVFSLTDEEARHGVATHSSGNHAAAVALAARLRGIPAHIVMPENAPSVKKAAVAGYGGTIVYCAPTLAAREATLERVVQETGATFLHPYNDARVIAGQGTAALELLTDVTDLDVIMAPVGGGGLLSGTAIVTAALAPGTRVIAAEPEAADDAYRSLQAGTILPAQDPRTIADGLRTSLGDLTFAVIQRHVKQIVTVSETAIIQAMRHVWERMKIVIEPSAAVPIGVLLEQKIDLTGQRIGVILSGGNTDVARLPWQE
ncbi:MAG: pyridoxal-phosphate dependent enzyme [Candidatus Tectomicrobia bacterium]|uniref:Pyridoxal-phosphate dependent enzyme n=1 Tax=Tectimicrobiota bacterium TaxID=2528274 RepID=A0A937VZD0_UNCTE|nr:pyridoxal-phosphate dependent enzyme [Candidatus Tectomicrobia bacterium]